MSKTVDERVVSMKFDNQHFETNVKHTMGTLDKLKQSLNFSGAAKGLEDIDSASRRVDLNPMGNAVESVRVKFSALQVMAVTALANITNSAVNAGKRIVNSLTIQPVTTGFQEYELKMGSIQTIMASTGASLEKVNGYLNELNEYSDKTIYSFSDMTSNIGKFTNAGVKLDDAVLAIKGISNEAAVSGANANEASRAMYNFAQALSAGYVKLIDWKSIELANMATVEFKTQLIQAAVAAGTLTDVGDGMYQTLSGNVLNATKNFNETLTDQWMTTDVLVNTLKDYADETTDIGKKAFAAAQDVKTFSMMMDTLKESAQSGWATSWEIIVGDYEESKKLWTNLSNAFGKIIEGSAKRRNNFLEQVLGGSTSKWDEFTKKINDAGVSTETFLEKLTETAREQGIPIDDLIKKHGSLVKVIKAGKMPIKTIVATFKKFTSGLTSASKVTDDMSDKLEYFQKVVDKVWRGDFANGEERVKKLTDAGYKYKEVQDLVNKTVDGHRLTLADLSDEQLKNTGLTEEQISKLRDLAAQAEKTGTPISKLIEDMSKPSGRELLIDSFQNIATNITNIIKAVKTAWGDVFKKNEEGLTAADIIYKIIEGFNELTEKLMLSDDALKKITDTARGLFKVLFFAKSVMLGLVNIIYNVISKVFKAAGFDILSITAYIGNLLTELTDWIFANEHLVNGLKSIGDRLGSGVEKIKKWTSAFFASEEIQFVLARLLEFITNLGSAFKDFFSKGAERFTDFIERIKDMDGITFSNIKAGFKDFIDNVLFYFLDIGKIVDIIVKAFTSFQTNVSDGLNAMSDRFEVLKETIGEIWKFIKTKIPAAILIAAGYLIIKLIQRLVNVLELLASPLKTLIHLNDAIDKVANAKVWELRSRAIRNMAIAIAVLAVAVVMLTLVDTKKLWSAVGALAVLIAMLAGLAFAVAAIGKHGGKIGFASASILALSASLLILASTLKIMSKLDPKKALVNVGILLLLAAGLVAITKLLGDNVLKSFKGAFTLIAMATAIKILVHALIDLDQTNFKNLGRSIFILAGLIIGLAMIAKVSQGISVGAALSIAALAIGLKMLVGAIEDIADLDARKMSKNIGSFIIVFGSIAVLMIATRYAGVNAIKAGIGILAISLALLLIIKAVKQLAELDNKTIENATSAIGKLLIIFGLVIAMSYFAGAHAISAGVMLLLMSGAMVILAGLITILKDIEPDGLDRAVEAIAKIALIFGALVRLSAFNSSKTIFAPIVALTIAVVLLGAVVAAFSFMDPTDLRNSVAALSILMIAFGILIYTLKFLEKVNWKSSVIILGAMLVVVWMLAAVIIVISKTDPGSSIEAAASISLLLLAIAGACMILSKSSGVISKAIPAAIQMVLVVGLLALVIGALAYADVGHTLEIAVSLSILLIAIAGACSIMAAAGPFVSQAIPAAYAMAGVVAILAAVIGALVYFDVTPTLEIAASLSLLLLSLSGACVILAGVGTVAVPALAGIGVLTALIIAVGAIMTALGALSNHFPSMETFLDKGIVLLEKIGIGLGSFVGGIVQGFVDTAILSLLPIIGTKLTEFMENIEGFLEGANNISSEAMSGVKSLAQMILILSAASLLEGIASFVTGSSSLDSFGEQLPDFGKAMADFSKEISGKVKPEAIEAAANAGKALAEMASTVPNAGGKLAVFLGDNNDLETFGDQLCLFGESMVKFSTTVDGNISESSIIAAANAGKALAEMASTVPNAGGKLAVFLGDNKIDTFGEQLVEFGESIVKFSTTVDGNISESSVIAAANAGKAMVELADLIPNTKGAVSYFVGDNDFETFGTQLVSFGESLSDYSLAVAYINVDAITNSASATDALISVAKKIPEMGGAMSKVTADSDLSTFGNELSKFSKYMVTYSDNVSVINTEAMSSSTTQFQRLANLAKGLVGVDFGGLSSFAKSMKTLGESGAEKFVEGFENAYDKASKAGKNMIANLISGIDGKKTDLTNKSNDMVKVITKTFTDSKDGFKITGGEIVGKLSSGITESKNQIISAFATLLSAAVTKINETYTSFYKAGKYLVEGFAAGIKANQWQAEAKANAMGKAALKAAEKALDEHSQSKETYKIGSFFVDGFANAIHNNTSDAYNASQSMAEYAKKGLTKAVSMVEDVLSNDMDSQPTIRPVLDLSDIKSGADAINGIFGMTPSVDVLSNVGAINTMMNRNQNGGNGDVISAIKDLGSKLGKTSGDTYQINGVTYDDGSNISDAVQSLVRAARVERRK